MKKVMSSLFESFSKKFFSKFFAAWFVSATFYAFFITGKPKVSDIRNVNFVLFLMIMVSIFTVLTAFEVRLKNKLISEKTMCAAILIFSCVVLTKSESMYTFIPFVLFFVLAVMYLKNKDDLTEEKELGKKYTLVFICAVTLFFVFFVTAISISRYKSYSSPNFDFGIFCNMYYNMKHGLSPVTTCERDVLLSHFAVHISPALYLFLPIYYVFPYPTTIALCQIFAIYSGIIPFLLIGKKYSVDNKILVFLSVIFAASPILAGGCMFDFHENCLLIPFIMWMLYFYEKNKTVPMFIFVVLTLLVKEDAFIYICVFAAYIIVSKKSYKKGFGMIIIALLWFLIACTLLQKYGTGVMMGRFDAMSDGNGGVMDIIKTVVFNPGYTTELMLSTKESDAEKLFYVIKLLFPVALMPFMTKKGARFILVLPILLNLLTSYVYQYNIFFQYSFGICALLFYASLINVADMERKNSKYISVVSAGIAVMLFCTLIFPQYANYVSKYRNNTETYKKMDEILEQIPEDKSVSATAFLVPKLTDRKEIYEAFYHSECDTDLLVIDIRPAYKEESMKIAEKYIQAGYTLTLEEEDILMIYESPNEKS